MVSLKSFLTRQCSGILEIMHGMFLYFSSASDRFVCSTNLSLSVLECVREIDVDIIKGLISANSNTSLFPPPPLRVDVLNLSQLSVEISAVFSCKFD